LSNLNIYCGLVDCSYLFTYRFESIALNVEPVLEIDSAKSKELVDIDGITKKVKNMEYCNR